MGNDRLVWVIDGFDSTEKLFEQVVPGNLSEPEVITLLQRLASRDLDPAEVIAASLRTSNKGYAAHLEPQRGQGNRLTITVGSGPYYTASAWRESDLKARADRQAANRTEQAD